MDFELVSTQVEDYKNVSTIQPIKGCHIINEELVGVSKVKAKPVLKLDKPIYLGMSILDLSKVHMYSFYYDVLKARYKDDVRLIYTDTDSYVIQTFTEDIYEDWKGIKDYMDFSGYDKNHPCYDATNKKVLGKVQGRDGWKNHHKLHSVETENVLSKSLQRTESRKESKGCSKTES